MTNCNSCGVPLADDDAFCPNCGAPTGKPVNQDPKTVMDIKPVPMFDPATAMQAQPMPGPAPVMQGQPMPVPPQVMPGQPMPGQPGNWQQMAAMSRSKNKDYAVAIKVLMVLGCVFGAFSYILPLFWCVPMTVIAWKKLDRGEPLGLAFKICTCIFVSRLAGLFMLLMRDEPPRYTQY